MSVSLFAFLGFYFVISIAVVTVSSLLYRYYRYRFLFHYNLFLVGSYLYGFLDVLSNHFALGLVRLQGESDASLQIIGHIFHFLAVPFLALSFYFFICMIVEILSGQFRTRYRIAFWVLEVLIIGTFLFLVLKVAGTSDSQIASTLSRFQTLVVVGHSLLAATLLVHMIRKLSSPGYGDVAGHLKVFGGVYLVLFLVQAGFVWFADNTRLVCYGQPVLLFLMHVFPLGCLWLVLRRHAHALDYERIDPDRVLDLFRQYGITEREQEVARLIGEGKSNREIEQTLFISIKTVKTHTYNIYRKLGINSRYQLIQLMKFVPATDSKGSGR